MLDDYDGPTRIVSHCSLSSYPFLLHCIIARFLTPIKVTFNRIVSCDHPHRIR